ncbi:hypothetical protein FKP32DRAFT_1758411 [Trametes sanguinea]|nr:hypothetical protein FKP32DRAFT_1758411 [Trametes sanguinea]
MSSLFNNESADIVVRSSDNVDFRLHKLVLSLASPVFNGMFSLPSDQNASDNPVEVTETSSTLEGLLRFCYPMGPPTFSQIDDLRLVLDAACKYEMDFVIEYLKVYLRLFLPSEPMRVYCIAYKCEDPELARAAASRLLEREDPLANHDSTPEFNELPMMALAKLTAYRKACAKAAADVLYDGPWMGATGFRVSNHYMYVSRKGNIEMSTSGWSWLTCESDETRCPLSTVVVNLDQRGSRSLIYPRQWWHIYRAAAAKELLRFRDGSTLSSVVTQRHLIQPALQRAATCPTCGPVAAVELLEYIEGVAKRIEQVVGKVQIDLPFKKA